MLAIVCPCQLKATDIVVPLCILAAMGLAVCLVNERQASLKLDAQNDALRRQLGGLTALAAENQRLSNLLAQANVPQLHQRQTGTTDPNAGLDELAQLRNQAEALLQQSNEVRNLEADTRATRDALDAARRARRARQLASQPHPAGNISGLPFEIVEASYGTDRTNLDVAAELSDRIQKNSLKVVADNSLAGDPDFGRVKTLSVVYRVGGTLWTNQFREGDIVVLPPESP
ncbi:MAG TPA: hypothetical protein VF988_17605 [Verrucomicrobiae bacterium]